jgi:hypothetical protein
MDPIPSLYFLHILSYLIMPTVVSIVLLLFGLALIRLLLGLRRVARDVGSVVISISTSNLDLTI